ncbi:MAG: hypothetical protein JWP30_742 [Homoserinimonas sp.]|nr:hypothetical protein [Homoserinimonas sp.]
MFTLFGRPKKHVVAPRLKPRSSKNAPDTNRVALAELTPQLSKYLGQAAYLQLSNIEVLSNLISTAPSVADKVAVTRIAALSVHKYEGLVAEMDQIGENAAELMEPFAPHIETFQRATLGGDWYEGLVTSYVTAGILDDFFIALAEGLDDDAARRIRSLLSDQASDLMVAELAAAIEANPRLASRLALWGRRLVGDTLLVARSALAVPENQHPDEARLEPVFTELIAAHTRRMDQLGLTA